MFESSVFQNRNDGTAEERLWRAVIARTLEEWVKGPLRYSRASAQKETRVHTHAGVPKTGWKYKGNGTRVQPPWNSAIAGPRFVLNIRPIESVDGVLCGLRGWEPAPNFSPAILLGGSDQFRPVLWRSIS
jgi:hypothetical protein